MGIRGCNRVNRFSGFIGACRIICLLLCLASGKLQAQNQTRSNPNDARASANLNLAQTPRKPSYEQAFLLASLLRKMGISKESKMGKKLQRIVLYQEDSFQTFEPESATVLKRIQGNSAVEHTQPDFEQVRTDFLKKRDAVISKLIERKKELLEAGDNREELVSQKGLNSLKALFQPKQIENCSESSTRSYSLKQGGRRPGYSSLLAGLADSKSKKLKKQEKDAGFIDILLLPSDISAEFLERISPEKPFGEKTLAQRFQADSKSALSLQASYAGVKCLPYRLRIRGDKKYIHYGQDALKNYDSKKGRFHPLVERRLHEFY